MSSKKPKAKIDRYYMSAHYGVCQGPVDEVKEILIKEKSAWRGRVTSNTTLSVNKEGLFGGMMKEGGVAGVIEVMFGGPTQKISSWLAGKLRRTPDTAPGYRGILSLVFRGSGGRGFYWTASTPYLGALWVRVARFPRQLDPATARIPRTTGVAGAKLSIFFVLDDSGSMSTGTRLATMKNAISHVLDMLQAQDLLDIGGSTFNNRTRSYRNATSLDVAAFKSWVNGLPADGGTNFLTGMQPAVDWFTATASDPNIGRRICIFITDGEASPTSSASQAASAAASLINRTIPVDIYGFNIDLSDTRYTQMLDNTPADGVPVVRGDDPSQLLAVIADAISGPEADANPAHIIYECLTNTDWGMGMSPSDIDEEAFADAARTLFGETFGLSIQWAQAASVQEFVNEILDCIRGSIFTNPRTGKLTLRLIRKDYDTETLREINPDNALLRNFSRKAWGETTNEMKVTWTNPETEGEETVYAQDLGNIAMQGAVISDSRNYSGVRKADLAQRLANRELRQASTPLCICEATVNRAMWDITPFECVKLTWPEYGLHGVVMRVLDVNYGKTGDSAIKLSLVEDVFSLPEVTFVNPPASEWVDPQEHVEPVSLGKIFPVPPYIVAYAGDSVEDYEYPESAVALLVAAPKGVLSADYYIEVEEPTPTGGTEWVVIGEPRGFLGRGKLQEPLKREVYSVISELDEHNGRGLEINSFLLIGPDDAPADKLEMALVTEIDEDTGEVTIMRGVLDTVPQDWPVGTPVWIGTGDDFEPIQESLVAGQTVRIRVSGWASGGAETAPVEFSGLVEARPSLPARPANLRLNGSGFEEVEVNGTEVVSLTWAHRNRLLEDAHVLAWDAAATPIEPGVTYSVVADLFDVYGNLIEERWFVQPVGTDDHLDVDLSTLAIPIFAGLIAFRVETERDEQRSLQEFSVWARIVRSSISLTFYEGYTPPPETEADLTFIEE